MILSGGRIVDPMNGTRSGGFIMGHPRFSSEEIVQRGEELYAARLRAAVEAGNEGKTVSYTHLTLPTKRIV